MIPITFSAMTFLDAPNLNIQYPYLAQLLIFLPIWAFLGKDEAQHTKEGTNIRFSNSITTMVPTGSASDTTRKNRNRVGLKHWIDDFDKWMDKYWKNEYVETLDFITMEEIFRKRLIDKKWSPFEEIRRGSMVLAENLKAAYDKD